MKIYSPHCIAMGATAVTLAACGGGSAEMGTGDFVASRAQSLMARSVVADPDAACRKLAESFKLPSSRGALIAGVLRGGPADKAGVKPGDVLTGTGYQFSDGQKILRLDRVVFADGKEMRLYGR